MVKNAAFSLLRSSALHQRMFVGQQRGDHRDSQPTPATASAKLAASHEQQRDHADVHDARDQQALAMPNRFGTEYRPARRSKSMSWHA